MFHQLLFVMVSIATFQTFQVLGAKKCGRSADVAFVIDASRSIYPPHFKDQLNFVKDMAESFNIGPTQTQIAAVTFSEGYQKEFFFNTYSEKSLIIEAIEDIAFTMGGRTDTGEGIKFARTEIFAAKNGARANVPHIMMVITDGRSTYGGLTVSEAAKAKNDGILIFAIGVGAADENELNNIASKPSSEYAIKVTNYKNLTQIQEKLALQACEALTTTPLPTTTPTTTPEPTTTSEPATTTEEKMQGDRPDKECISGKDSDVIFVLDESSSIDNKDFKEQLRFVQDVIALFDIGPKKTQVGVVTFSDLPTIEFYLNTHHKKKAVLEAVGNISYSGGNTYTNLALETVRDKLLSPRAGARPGVAKIIVVITDGVSRMPKNTAMVAEEIKKRGVYMFAIGVGKEFDQDAEELINLASSPSEDFVQTVNGYNALGTIKDLLSIKKCKTGGGGQNDILTTCGSRSPADVMFVTDFSQASSHEVVKSLKVIGNIAKGLDVGKDKVHVGLVSSDCPDVGDVNPLQYYDGTSFAMAISSQNTEIQVSKLLYRAREDYLTSKYGRKKAKRVIVLYTNGPISDFTDTAREIYRAQHRINDVRVIVVSGSSKGDKDVARLPARMRILSKDLGNGESVLKQVCQAIKV